MSPALAAGAASEVGKYATTRQIEMTKREAGFVPTTKFGVFWKSLSPTTRNVIVIVGVGTAIYGGYRGVRAYQKWLETRGSREEIEKSKKDLKDLIKKGVKPSYSESQYKTWANQLKESFDGCGTSYTVVKDIVEKMNNDADLLKLTGAYGTATFDKCGVGTGDFTGTLGEALTTELSSGEMKEVNNLLKKHGLNRRF